MVLRPLSDITQVTLPNPAFIPAWQVVEKTQKPETKEFWLIAQPDHAALAGDLAARLELTALHELTAEIIRAISIHDEGWSAFDHAVLERLATSTGPPPRSFLEIQPSIFLRAWTGSIDAAEHVGPLGGIIVSEHFCRLGRNRLASRNDGAQDRAKLEGFLAQEEIRQVRLRLRAKTPADGIELLTDILQFCDLVSLYLCCGTTESAEFPQEFKGKRVRVRSEGGAYIFSPSVFGRGTALGISARRYPGSEHFVTLPLLVA